MRTTKIKKGRFVGSRVSCEESVKVVRGVEEPRSGQSRPSMKKIMEELSESNLWRVVQEVKVKDAVTERALLLLPNWTTTPPIRCEFLPSLRWEYMVATMFTTERWGRFMS